MKHIIFLILIAGFVFSARAQNYVSGTVSFHGTNTAGGTTLVAPGASFYLYKNTLYEQGNFLNYGDSAAISADSGTLILSGAATQSLSGRFNIAHLRLTNSTGALLTNNVLPSMITVLDSLSFGAINNAVFNAGDSLLTLRSTAVKTARIADLTNGDVNTGNIITGKVEVERFLPNKRAWRLLGLPTTGDSTTGQTIKTAWQEGATAAQGQTVNPHPGYGTLLTRPGNQPPAATGYDDGVAGSTAYSLRMYTKDGLLTQPPNTDGTAFSAHAAYLVEVRGDRSVPAEVQTSTYQTPSTLANLRSKGVLHNGVVKDTVTNAAGSFAGVANPYASAIDFSKAGLDGVNNGFYAWAPAIGTLGAWLYIDGSDNYNATPKAPANIGAYTNSATNMLIGSGQGILVKPTGSFGIVTFKESNKNITDHLNGFRETPLPSINISLYGVGDSNQYVFTDGTATVFDESFSRDALTDEDIFKPGNITENLSFYTAGAFLMKEKYPMPQPGDTLPLQLWKTATKKYRFVMDETNMPASPQAYLLDGYTHASTAIHSSTAYDFDITDEAASEATTRFAVVFGNSVLPVTLTSIKAYLQNEGVNVEWTVQNENGVSVYEVEKSPDGKTFVKIGTVPVKGGNAPTYNLFDAQPFTGDDYYRVKIISAFGEVTYTSVVKITISGGIMTVTVSPNPVKNGVIRLQFAKAPAGKYLLTLFGGDGKQIAATSIAHAGGGGIYTLPAAALTQGIYGVEIRGSDNKQVFYLPVIVVR